MYNYLASSKMLLVLLQSMTFVILQIPIYDLFIEADRDAM